MLVRQVFDEGLAQYAYLVGDPATGEAVVIDPERDVDRYFELAEHNGLRLVAGVETHIHADYLSGLRELAERGLRVYASDEGGADWRYEWLLGSAYDHRLLKDGESFRLGEVEFEAVHTPGHTPEHLSFLIRDHGSASGVAVAIATGDFVFVGDVGRPDLLETAAGVEGAMESGARDLFRSLARFSLLPEFLQVWPGHGAGSACGKSLGDVPLSTVGYELRTSPALRAAESESAFVEYILSGQPDPPLYFRRMKRENREGPRLLGRLPRPRTLSAAELGRLAGRRDVAVLDTRSRADFLQGHLPASLLAERDFQLATVAGSYVEPGTPIYLVSGAEHVEPVVRTLVRVGLDEVRGYATPEVLAEYAAGGGELRRTERIDMAELERRRVEGSGRVLDVRGSAEYAEDHVPGALNVPHTRLPERLRDIPRGETLLVHCGTGARSAAAVALLERAGFAVANVADRFDSYRPTGAPQPPE